MINIIVLEDSDLRKDINLDYLSLKDIKIVNPEALENMSIFTSFHPTSVDKNGVRKAELIIYNGRLGMTLLKNRRPEKHYDKLIKAIKSIYF